ncbi:MAG: NUDIX hydrolase [Bacteroides sp.]|nr:NUDIX hydrolase [Bacillota bacterium]MCM1394171.1 NUDIX hydrolase [[Eubacterium] siraeum]MCM1455446.1 NUDIX hydrolase [Bacteroides sp.]
MDKNLNLTEIEKTAHVLYEGWIISLRVDDVTLPDGRDAKREYVSHRGGAAVLAVDDEEYVYLVRQFRYPYREELVEIPAGKLEEGEEAIYTARRELDEEIGMTAEEILPFGVIYPTPGYTDEHLHIFLAKGLKKTHMHLDDGEFLRVERVPYKTVLSQVLSGEIKDGKTCYAILKYALHK